MRVTTLVIVGVGLLGGSVALAARRRDVAEKIIGVDSQQGVLDQALRLSLIDNASDLLAAAAAADLMVFCTPVDLIASQILAAASACRPGCLLTDVGSTKAVTVHTVESCLPSHVTFVGSHPLAGSDKNGSEHARAALFDRRLVIVTPTPRSDPASVERIKSFWRMFGANVRVMEPEAHDCALALTSHLPHVVASALAGVLSPDLFSLTATGFRDTTRLAASNPALWTAILSANSSAVIEALDRYGEQLALFRAALADNDRAALEAILSHGKQNKDAVSQS